MKKIQFFRLWCTVCVTLYIFLQMSVASMAKESSEDSFLDTQLFAKAAVLMDADSGRVLYAKNGTEALPMASTTKILTCIIALEQCELDEVVTFSKYAASMPDVQLNAKEGECFYLGDLLYSLMLESHNDVAMAIAEHVGGGKLEFANLMNRKAKEIGCKSSFFVSPNGLDGKGTYVDENGNEVEKVHSTTAEDLALIMRYCIHVSPQSEQFLKITGTSSYSFGGKKVMEDGSVVENGRSFSCNNHNSFLHMMQGAFSGKTGFTNDAGYCYVGALKRDGKTLIVSLLGCGWPYNRTYKWKDTEKLMTYGLENFEHKDMSEYSMKQYDLNAIEVENGQTEKVGEVAQIPLVVRNITDEDYKNGKIHWDTSSGMLVSSGEEIEERYDVKTSLQAPVGKGEKVGVIQYYMGDEMIISYEVITAEAVDAINYLWCIAQIFMKIIL